MKVYLLGPMTGYPDFNRPTFRAAKADLESLEFSVVCPDELDSSDPAGGNQWADYMKRDLPYLFGVDVGIALPNWEDSDGACTEVFLLTMLRKPVYLYSERLGAAHLSRIGRGTIRDAAAVATARRYPVGYVIPKGGSPDGSK